MTVPLPEPLRLTVNVCIAPLPNPMPNRAERVVPAGERLSMPTPVTAPL